MILAIDFDGVVHDYKNPLFGRRMGAPVEGAQAALAKLARRHTIIIFSVWGDSPAMKEWLFFYKIRYHKVTNVKPVADVYIDDRALRFTTWYNVLVEIGSW